MRGDLYGTPGGGYGRFVGITGAGVEWVAYHDQDFRAMCRIFDALAIASRQ